MFDITNTVVPELKVLCIPVSDAAAVFKDFMLVDELLGIFMETRNLSVS